MQSCIVRNTGLRASAMKKNRIYGFRPFRVSVKAAGLYIILCAGYIWLSGRIAAQFSKSLSTLQIIELYKGIAFVVVTGVMIFVFFYRLLSKIEQQNREIDIQRKAIAGAQARALTGVIAGGIAHDINNLLGVIKFDMDDLAAAVPDNKKISIDRLNRVFLMISEMTGRMQRVGKARSDDVEMSCTDINSFINMAVELARRHEKVKSCEVGIIESTPLSFMINPFFLEHAVINLILNAAEAVESNGKIAVHIVDRSGQLVIEVHDNGPGISEDEIKKILQPYYTTKEQGTGLGLTTVKTCAELHGGRLEIGRSPLGGALFSLILPVKEGKILSKCN